MKSRLLIAAVVVLGSVSFAAAQSIPRLGDDSSQANYGPVAGGVSAPVDQIPAAASDRLGDDSGQASYARDTGTSAFAEAPAAPAEASSCFRLGDDSNQTCYAR